MATERASSPTPDGETAHGDTAHGETAHDGTAGDERAAAATLAGTVVVLFAAGLLFGLIGSFLIPYRLPHGIEGLTAAIALIGNAVLVTLGGVGTGRTIAALAPAAGWLVSVGVITTWAPGGDVVVPGSLATDPGVPKVGIAFLLLGLVGAAIGLFLTHREVRRRGTRPATTGGGQGFTAGRGEPTPNR